jgi:hypothetical protein
MEGILKIRHPYTPAEPVRRTGNRSIRSRISIFLYYDKGETGAEASDEVL